MRPGTVEYRKRRERKMGVWRMSPAQFDALPFLTREMNEDLTYGRPLPIRQWRSVLYGNCMCAYDGNAWRVVRIVVRADVGGQ